MSLYNMQDDYTMIASYQDDVAFKRWLGKVHTSTGTEHYSEVLTSSIKISPARIMSGSVPRTPPTSSYQTAALNGVCTHTGTLNVLDGPEGGRIFLCKDRADTTGRTWVAVHSGSWKSNFNSTGSDRDLILTDFIAPWNTTGSWNESNLYAVTVYACTGSGNPPGQRTVISSSNKMLYTFNYDAGVLTFVNPTLTFNYEDGFSTFEENYLKLIAWASASDFDTSGWSILSETKSTTAHQIVFGGTWLSGTTHLPLSYLDGYTTGSCIAIEGFRYIGGMLNNIRSW